MENGDDKQYAPVETSVSADSGGGFSVDELDSEYGDGEQAEQVLNVSAESRAPSTSNNEFYNYKSEVRKQNCLFGSSVMSVAGLLIAAYFLMGLSFTPANIGIFGDETNMKGSSGERFCQDISFVDLSTTPFVSRDDFSSRRGWVRGSKR